MHYGTSKGFVLPLHHITHQNFRTDHSPDSHKQGKDPSVQGEGGNPAKERSDIASETQSCTITH